MRAISPTSTNLEVKREPEEQRSSRQSTRARASLPDNDQSFRESEASSIQPSPAPAPAPRPNDDTTPFDTVLSTLETILEPSPNTVRRITPTGVLTKLYMDYKFPSYKNGQSGCHKIPIEEVIHYNAKELLNRLDKSKLDNPNVFKWLEELARTKFSPVAIPLSHFPYRIVLREKKNVPPKSHQTTTDSGPTFDGVDDFMPPHNQSQSPRSGAGAGKGMKVPGIRPKSSLRPIKSSKKRPHAEVDSDSDSNASGAKRSHFFQDGDDSMEEAGDAISNQEPDDPVEIVIRADKIPSTVPQGLHDTWTCDQEDCNYVVRGGDEEECQTRIKQHFNEHERQMERVQLAMTEGNRGHVQIKYAYFPPFLILVHINQDPSTTPSSLSPGSTPAARTAAFTISPARDFHDHIAQFRRDASHATPSPKDLGSSLQLGGRSQVDFRTLVQRFRRKPHPVSDKIHTLTILQQQPPRKDQETRRTVAGVPDDDSGRHVETAADQDESDSMTERE